MLAFFLELFDFNDQGNQCLLAFMKKHYSSISPKAISLFSHILNAHQIWNFRIKGLPGHFTPLQVHPFEDFTLINEKNHIQTLSILKNIQLEKQVRYKMNNGMAYTNRVHELLFQIINHST